MVDNESRPSGSGGGSLSETPGRETGLLGFGRCRGRREEKVDSIAGVGYARVTFHDGAIELRQRHYAAKVLGSTALVAADREALAVTVDVADVDQIKLMPTGRP